MSIRPSTPVTKILTIFSSFALGALLLAGCSSAPAEGAAAEATPSLKEAAATLGTFENTREEYMRKMSSCLDDHGAQGDSVSQQIKDAADAACAEEVGAEPQPTAEDSAAMRVYNGELRSCIIAKGHKVPDLQADGQWDNEAMSKLLKTDATLNQDSGTCFDEMSQ
ncbi:hypothetical protein C5C18_06840 [Rathayibacter tritici]|uniref:Secreted protein n=1 Tax=Rathayibacter tritici TaxID=33888 RepID=A0A160KPL7_9MICO|nr:hypothetical protein [Rathayibacter tritici]AND15410.1 hypothetical protein A6122_0248 [Rathayibacter tritici]PPF27762.1 hypothetical protein C5C06_09075 [Rathayibacter tritici]PPF65750.1 hypothetical protein C5C21_10805 [Rathayibacter tritici]PPG07516.1 hypothetical protein C5C18_06840 [Rathayibacter tritici]PPI17333.1 hypothetical protein C5D07_04735 [Rathayibacter tritici]